MRNTFEVVFENVPAVNAVDLVDELLSHVGAIEFIEFSEGGSLGNNGAFDRKLLTIALLGKQDLTVTIRVRRFAIDATVLDVVLIRVIKYDDNIDVEISFDVDEAKQPGKIMHSLHVYALEIAKSFSTGDVYGGLEPADDFATRYFTNMQFGPLPSRED